MPELNMNQIKKNTEKMYDYICEQLKANKELFEAYCKRVIYEHRGFDPMLDQRIREMFNELPAKERLAIKVNAEYEAFQSFWKGCTQDDLINQAEKISIINKLHTGFVNCLNEEQAEYFLQFCEPLEAVSDSVIINGNHAHEWSLIGQVVQTMFENGDGGAYYDMEEEYYEEAAELTQEL